MSLNLGRYTGAAVVDENDVDFAVNRKVLYEEFTLPCDKANLLRSKVDPTEQNDVSHTIRRVFDQSYPDDPCIVDVFHTKAQPVVDHVFTTYSDNCACAYTPRFDWNCLD